MKEIRSLRQQLTNIVKSTDTTLSSITVDPKMSPPTKEQETLIRQIITAGSIDQVACLTREGSSTFYSVLHSTERVYIHPSSFVFDSPPDFCVYREITHTSRPYMKGVTSINPSWLPVLGKPLCHFSKPLETSTPRYDPESDSIKCVVRTTYGPHSWDLPLHEMEYPGQDRYKYFARFLLEGEIFPKFKHILPFLSAHPSLITKGYTSNKVVMILQALKTCDIDTKAKLESKWYLLLFF